MPSKIEQINGETRIYPVNCWQDYLGANWNNLNAINPDSSSMSAYPQGKNSTYYNKPRSIFLLYNASLDTDNKALDKAYFAVHMKKSSVNDYPSLKVFVGNQNTPYISSPIGTVSSPEKITESDSQNYVNLFYKLPSVDLGDLSRLIIEMDWARTKSSSSSEVRLGSVMLCAYLSDKNKITISQSLTKTSLVLGQTTTWNIKARQDGAYGARAYAIEIPANCRITTAETVKGTFEDGVWTVRLSKGEVATLNLVIKPATLGEYELNINTPNKVNLLKTSFVVNEPPIIDKYGITYTFYNDIYVRNLGYFDITITGETNTTTERHYNVIATLQGEDYSVLVNPLYLTAEILPDSTNIDGGLIEGEDNINFNLESLGSYCLHLRVPIWSWDNGWVTVECKDEIGEFEILEIPKLILNTLPSWNSNDITTTSVNIGTASNWTIRAKADRHSFMKLNDDEFEMTIEAPPAYIGCVRLSRPHSADVTASVTNTLIEDRYRNRVYMGKKGDFTENITMKLRLPPEDVTTLEGLVELDKPVPIDTIPDMWDGNSLNHRGWAELYGINNIKKINERLYDCEPQVRYLTHEINTEFTVVKDKAVYPASNDSEEYPLINTYLVNTHSYNDLLTKIFVPSPHDFYTDVELEEGYAGAYEIPANNELKLTSQLMQPYGNWDYKFRNTLPSVQSEDYDYNWKMAIRLRDNLTNDVLFEHLYHDFEHFEENGKIANKCKVTDTWFNGVNYEIKNYSNMYLTKDNFTPLIDSEKKPVVIKMDGTIKSFNNNNRYPTDVEYSIYRQNPHAYDNYDVVNVINIPIEVDIYHIPETDPATPSNYYSMERKLSRKEITNHNDSNTIFNVLVKNSDEYVANKKVKITITDNIDYKESWVKLTDAYGRVNIDMSYDRSKYEVYVEFDESEDYLKANGQFFIDVEWNDEYTETLFEYESADRFVTYDDTYTVQLIDEDGNALVNKEVYYSFSSLNNTQYTASIKLVTDNDGKINIPILYNNGVQHLKVHFRGDDTYNPSVFAELISIDIPNNAYTIEADDMIYESYDVDKTYSGILTYNGNPVANKEVIIRTYSDGNTITKTVNTNSNGVFTTTFNLGFGLWYVDMIVNGSSTNATTCITRTLQVNFLTKVNTLFSYNQGFTLSRNGDFPNGLFKVTLKTENNELLSNQPINFEIIGDDTTTIQSCVIKTNKDGEAILPWYSETEDVLVKFTYDGGVQYNFISGSARVYHAENSTSAECTYNNIRGQGDLVVTPAPNNKITIREVKDSETLFCQFLRNGSAISNLQTMVYVDEINEVSYSKTHSISKICKDFTVGETISVQTLEERINQTINGAISYPPMRGSSTTPKTYHVTIYYKDTSGAIKGGKITQTIVQNTSTRMGGTSGDPWKDYIVSAQTITPSSGDEIAQIETTFSTQSNVDLAGKIVRLKGSGKNYYSVIDSENKARFPIMRKDLPNCPQNNNWKIWIEDFEDEPGENNITICGYVAPTKTVPAISVTGLVSGALQSPTITTNPEQIFSLDIELQHVDTSETFTYKITPSDDGISKPLLITNMSGVWTVLIKATDVSSDCTENIYYGVVNGRYVTYSFYNSLPTENGHIVMNPTDMGKTFGSDVSIELRNGTMSLIDYGMVVDNEKITGGKIFVDNLQLPSQSVYSEVEISYGNIHNQRINPLMGLLQVNTLENVQVDAEEIAKYQNIVCSPSPVPNNRCWFTRHTSDGTLYFFNSTPLDENNKIYGVKYLGCPYNQYKGGTDLKTYSSSGRGISIFNLENGYSPVYMDNGLVKIGFHRYSGYVELWRFNENINEYIFVNALKIANNPKLKLKENNYSDDKITIQFGNTEWTTWRGKPWVEVKHSTDDLRILNTPNMVTCEITSNKESMGYIEDIDIYLGKFTPFKSVQQFKKELCIGENIKTDNFDVVQLEEETYNVLEDRDESELQETIDSLFTKEEALRLIKKDDSSLTGVCFPANGSYVAKPNSSFSLLIENMSGNLPIKIKCRGYTSPSQIPEKGSTTQVGVWENIQEIDPTIVETKVGVNRYKCVSSWENIPEQVEYIDFILIFDDETTFTFNKIMLYEGVSDKEYSRDDSIQKSIQTEVQFDKTYYANIYNEKDDYGLGIFRPHQNSFTLKYITAAPLTVLVPYIKKSSPYDKMDKLVLEYVNSYDQIVSIENIGGFI